MERAHLPPAKSGGNEELRACQRLSLACSWLKSQLAYSPNQKHLPKQMSDDSNWQKEDFPSTEEESIRP